MRIKHIDFKNNRIAYCGLLIAVIVIITSLSTLSPTFRSYSAVEALSRSYTIQYYDGTYETFDSQEEYEAAKEVDQINATNELGKGILANPFESFAGGLKYFFNSIGAFFVDNMVNNFDPTFSSWYRLEHADHVGNPISLLEKASPTEVVSMNETEFNAYMPLASMIFRAAKIIGLVLSTLLLMLSLFMCLFGQSNSIRTTPIKALLMYVVSLICIFVSYKLVIASMKTMYAVWDVITSVGGRDINWTSFSACETLPNSYVRGLVMITSAFFLKWFALIIVIILLIKPIKGFFKLYCQLVEYYIAYIVMLLMFPAVIATIISPSTINIFKAYIRLLIMEMLLFTFSGVFMKIFVMLLVNGSFFASISNYIACLCIVKVAQNLQQYAAAIGINSVQATGNFMQAVGSGFMGLMSGITALTRGGSNVGNMMKNTGVAMNNEKLFKMGSAMQNPMQMVMQSRDNTMPSYSETIHNNFTSAMIQRGKGINSNAGFNQYSSVNAAVNGTMPRSYTGAMQEAFGSDYENQINSVKHYANGQVFAASGSKGVLIDSDGTWKMGNSYQDVSDEARISEAEQVGNMTGWHNGFEYGSIQKEGGGLELPDMIEGIQKGKGNVCSMTTDEVQKHIISPDEYLVKTHDYMTNEDYFTAAYPESMVTPEISKKASQMGFVDLGINVENGCMVHNYQKVERTKEKRYKDDDDGDNRNYPKATNKHRDRRPDAKGNKA